MIFCDSNAGFEDGLRIVMEVQTGVVDIALAGGEFSVYRYGTGKVCIVSAVSGAKVHQDQLTILTLLVIGYIMEYTGTVAARDNGVIGFPGGPVAEEFMEDLCMDLIFPHAGTDKAQQAAEGFLRNINGLLYHLYFFRGFHHTGGFEDRGGPQV